jgi:tetratricopeptide (TPR) repeat protein
VCQDEVVGWHGRAEDPRAEAQQRLLAYRNGDDDAVTSDGSLALAGRLAAAEGDPQSLLLAAWLYRCRAEALHGTRDHATALERAEDLMILLVKSHADGLPAELRHFAAHAATKRLAETLGKAQAQTDPAALDTAVDLGALAAGHLGGPEQWAAQVNLATALAMRYERAGDPADNDAAIALLRVVLAQPDAASLHARLANNLAMALRSRFDRSGHGADLAESVDLLSGATESAPDQRTRALFGGNLATAQMSLYEFTGDGRHLDEAIDAACAAVAVGSSLSQQGQASRLSTLGTALRERAERTGRPADMEASIDAHRNAVAAAVPGDPARLGILVNFGNALRSRFEQLGSFADLDEAIGATSEAVSLSSHNYPGLPRYLANLGAMLRSRGQRASDVADVDQAIDHTARAVALAQADDPHLARYRSNLCAALTTRHELTGSTDDLDRAVDAGRQGVSLNRGSALDRARCMANLAAALISRYQVRNRLGDAEEAASLFQQAVQTVPLDHVDRARYLTNLAGAFQTIFVRTESRSDIDACVTAARAAVDATPESNPDHPGRQTMLMVALMTRYRQAGNLADLDEALSTAEVVLAATPRDGVARSTRLSNASLAYLARFQLTGAVADGDMAVDYAQAAVAASPPDSPSQGTASVNLGLVQLAQGDAESLEAAAATLSEAAGLRLLPSTTQVIAAEGWARAAARRAHWAEAAEAYQAAVARLQLLAHPLAERRDSEFGVGSWSGLARDASAAAVLAGGPELAVTVSEAGRAVLWRRQLELRTEFTLLDTVAPDLAARASRIRRALDASE